MILGVCWLSNHCKNKQWKHKTSNCWLLWPTFSEIQFVLIWLIHSCWALGAILILILKAETFYDQWFFPWSIYIRNDQSWWLDTLCVGDPKDLYWFWFPFTIFHSPPHTQNIKRINTWELWKFSKSHEVTFKPVISFLYEIKSGDQNLGGEAIFICSLINYKIR